MRPALPDPSMTAACPTCRRTLNPASGAVFCMFCGGRLADPDATGDLPTAAFVPADPPPPAAANGDAVPERVGGYRLLRPLGEGGMGRVFEAESDDSGERVAVKLLSPKLAGNPTTVERFKQEGRLASQISHPRCVFVLGADTDAGRPFIVMELMPGGTLKHLVDDRGPLPPDEAVARILDVIDGLIEAHRLGVIHRDVKPSNCFLTADDRVKVGDFGLSKSLAGEDDDKQLTGTGAFLGTVLFASPEQIRGDEVGYTSDVYSVAATLYYLLTARAPYQHDSLTAAVARAISEPPPPIRRTRPEVPRALERVVLRGLERDPDRRWATLEEFRDAVAELQPHRLLPARPRSLVAAYFIDFLVILFALVIPAELAESALGLRRGWWASVSETFEPLWWLTDVAYFGLLEGLFGVTAGKWLLRLRVTGVGRVGPPGVGPAVVRAVAFNLMLMVAFVPLYLLELGVSGPGLVLGLAVGAAGLAGPLYQLRQSAGGRGLHDRASGCRVVQRPRPPHRVKLVSRRPNPIDAARGGPAGLPPTVGGFVVRGKLVSLPDGGGVWVAKDPSLRRRVLIWVRPAAAVPNELPPAPVRPTRLRAVSSGDLLTPDGSFFWQAFVAPTGAPLADTVSPDRPLPWADARTVLEQVADELKTAAADGTLPDQYGIDHLWAEPGGRVHLTEFPIPPASPPKAPPCDKPLDLLRQVATLALEGRPRSAGGPVRAPLPPHATEVTDRLFRPDGSVEDVHRALADSHAHPPAVTTAMRAVHVGVGRLPAAVGLLVMAAIPLTYCLLVAVLTTQWADFLRSVAGAVRDPALAARLAAEPRLANPLRPDRRRPLLARLDDREAAERQSAGRWAEYLSRPEKSLLARTTAAPPPEGVLEVDPEALHAILKAVSPDEAAKAPVERSVANLAVVLLVAVPLAFVGLAFAFRGGPAFLVSGIALVRRDGRPAGRLRCAARELILWLPPAAVLAALLLVQARLPGWFVTRLVLSGVVLGAFAAAAAVAVRVTARGPHDRLVGTYMVPR